jgi:AAA15 family ATPase/GTPase
MSDGFIAAIDIIADLILKMQDSNSLTRNYQKQGIVLIDEIETHLHLELQRIVMPLLTNIFPNIQFIVTTHSPFVLNSMENAVAYDLEHRETISDLTKYSYEALAEGYFGVPTESSYMEMRLLTLKALLEKEDLSNGDKEQLLSLISDFEKISAVASPLVVGEFMRLQVDYSDKINALQK